MLLIALAAATALAGVDPRASVPLAPVASDHAPGSCHVRLAPDGVHHLPDPACTPGAVNPTLTVAVLRDKDFRTGLVRDKLTSADQKRRVYVWYGITPPKDNTGQNQVCELDHVIDLSAGGGDGLANIWPECGPADVPVGEREFKLKDRFAEHVMIAKVKAGVSDAELAQLQKEIAADWTQFGTGPAGKAQAYVNGVPQ